MAAATCFDMVASIGPLKTFEGLDNVKRGDIVELNEASAKRYLASGYIETNLKGPIGLAYEPGERDFLVGAREAHPARLVLDPRGAGASNGKLERPGAPRV